MTLFYSVWHVLILSCFAVISCVVFFSVLLCFVLLCFDLFSSRVLFYRIVNILLHFILTGGKPNLTNL